MDMPPPPHATVYIHETDLCADIHCPCSHTFHIDGFNLTSAQCPYCHQLYSLSLTLNVRDST